MENSPSTPSKPLIKCDQSGVEGVEEDEEIVSIYVTPGRPQRHRHQTHSQPHLDSGCFHNLSVTEAIEEETRRTDSFCNSMDNHDLNLCPICLSPIQEGKSKTKTKVGEYDECESQSQPEAEAELEPELACQACL